MSSLYEKYGIVKTIGQIEARGVSSMQRLAKEKEEKSKALYEEQVAQMRDNYGSPLVKRTISGAEVTAKRINVEKKLIDAFIPHFIANVVQESVPFDLSHISAEEMLEQVQLVESMVFRNVIDSKKLRKNLSPFIDLADRTSLNLTLGLNRGDHKPVDLVRTLSGAVARVYTQYHVDNSPEVATRKHAIDTLDIINTNDIHFYRVDNYSDNAKATELSETCNVVLNDITAKLAEHVKQKVAKIIVADKRSKEDKDELLEGLDVYSSEITKSRERRKAYKVSLLEELYKNSSVLQESHGGTVMDYFNEAVFHMSILETYRALDCVTKSDEDIAILLRKERSNIVR